MARQPRIDVAGCPQHIIQRGHNRSDCFFQDDDYRQYLDFLAAAVEKFACQVHAYVLMPNHIHLLATGANKGAIASLMQSVGRQYVGYINQTYARTGTLWEGRFRSALLESERYLLACCCYMELNPVRAGFVREPGGYPWSSYRHHTARRRLRWMQDHDAYLQLGRNNKVRAATYRNLVAQGVSEADLQAIRDHTNKGRVLGSTAFQAQISAILDRPVAIRPRGRPRKTPDYAQRTSSR